MSTTAASATPVAPATGPGWRVEYTVNGKTVRSQLYTDASLRSQVGKRSPDVVVVPKHVSCPSATKHTGSLAAYNCEYMVYDGDNPNHAVKFRAGKTGSDAGGGFGVIHAEIDHWFYQPMMDWLVQHTYGAANIDGPHKYDYFATHYSSNGTMDQDMRLIENRNVSNGSGDNNELGLQTAYCQLEPGGSEEQLCPEWVSNDFTE